MKFKQLLKELTEMVENQQPLHFKERAYKELARVDLSSKPCTRFILDDYPDFDSLCFRIKEPGRLIVKIHINWNELRGNPKATKKVAKMLYTYMKNKETIL